MKAKFISLSAAIMLTAITAAAQVAYAGTTGYFFNGGDTGNVSSSNPSGADAYITTANPTVTYAVSAAWDMIDDVTTPNGNYAQVGWVKDAGWSGPQIFTQWASSTNYTNPPTTYDGAPPSGSNDYNLEDTTRSAAYGGYIYFNAVGQQLGQVYWNNVFDSGSACNNVQYYEEIHNTSDYWGGSPTSPVTYSSVRYLSNNTGVWSRPYIGSWNQGDSTAGQNHSNYTTSASFTVWDTQG